MNSSKDEIGLLWDQKEFSGKKLSAQNRKRKLELVKESVSWFETGGWSWKENVRKKEWFVKFTALVQKLYFIGRFAYISWFMDEDMLVSPETRHINWYRTGERIQFSRKIEATLGKIFFQLKSNSPVRLLFNS